MTATSTREFRGITFGGSSPYQVTDEEGLDEITVRTATRKVPRGEGGIPGPHFRDMKHVVVKGWHAADTVEEAQELFVDLQVAMRPAQDTDPYYLRHPGEGDKFIRARPLRLSPPRSVWTERLAVFEWTAIWEVADPRVYGIDTDTTLVGAFSAELVGFNLPANLPFNMNAAPQTLAGANNTGTANAYPLIQVQFPSGGSGDHTGFTLTNLATGVEVVSSAELTAGQTLTIDMDAYVRYTGDLVFSVDGASRIGFWERPRDEFFLAPGSNLIKFEPVGSATVVARLTWRPTY